MAEILAVMLLEFYHHLKIHTMHHRTITWKQHHPQNLKYVTYCNTARGGPSHTHSQCAHKFRWCLHFRVTLANIQTHKKTHSSYTLHCSLGLSNYVSMLYYSQDMVRHWLKTAKFSHFCKFSRNMYLALQLVILHKFLYFCQDDWSQRTKYLSNDCDSWCDRTLDWDRQMDGWTTTGPQYKLS